MARTVADIMTRSTVTVRQEDTVALAAQLMRQNDTGSVPVINGRHPVGVITDRDIATRVVAAERPASTPVGEAATMNDVVTIEPQATLERASALMREHSVRRLAVTMDGELVGMVSLGDLALERDAESGLGDISAAEPNQ